MSRVSRALCYLSPILTHPHPFLSSSHRLTHRCRDDGDGGSVRCGPCGGGGGGGGGGLEMMSI